MKKSLFMIVLVFATVAFAAAQAAPAPSAPQSAPPSSTAGAGQTAPPSSTAGAGQTAPPSSTAGAPTGQPAQPGAAGQTQPGQPGATAGQTGQPAAPQQKKEIKNAAEYNAYMGALNTQDPNQKAQALESFLQTYPDSVVKEDALELLLAAYQQAQNMPKLLDSANRLLQVNPNNIRALAILSYLHRANAQSSQNPQQAQQELAQAAQFGQRGLQALQTWPKPEGMSDADYAKQKDSFAAIFNSSVGLNAFQQKNYPEAQRALRDAAQLTPNDFSVVYPLALAYLEAKPADEQNGIYMSTRAAILAPTPQLKQQLMTFAQKRYDRFHGGDDGFDQLQATAQQSPFPPQGFQIQPGPTPQEQVAKLVQTKDVKDMSFDEFQMIFQNGAPADKDKVWNEIKGKPIAFEAKVVQSSPKQLSVAATYDDIQKNVADVTITMENPIPAKAVPAPGGMAQVQGSPESYTPEPFMIVMSNGRLVGKSAPKTTTPKTTPTRRGTTTRKKG